MDQYQLENLIFVSAMRFVGVRLRPAWRVFYAPEMLHFLAFQAIYLYLPMLHQWQLNCLTHLHR